MSMQPHKIFSVLAIPAAAAAVIAITAIAYREGATNADDGATAVRQEPRRPATQVEFVHARPFRLEVPYRHTWRADREVVTHGWLVVVEAPREFLVPRQTYEPVLYVGAQTADRVNLGTGSGRIVTIVPGDVDWRTTRLFFGAPALPENLRAIDIAAAADGAVAAGLPPVDPQRLADGTELEPLVVEDEYALRLAAMDLVEQYAPDERELVEGWRVPRIR
jgi:hypothetical protein